MINASDVLISGNVTNVNNFGYFENHKIHNIFVFVSVHKRCRPSGIVFIGILGFEPKLDTRNYAGHILGNGES